MTATIAAGKSIIQSAPTLQCKVLAVGSSIMAATIKVKNTTSNMSSTFG
jgi:hypothetical protein